MNNESITYQLAHYASTLSYEDIPETVCTVAKHCLLDWFGVTIAGAQDPASQLMFEECLETGATPSQATLPGKNVKLPVLQAALANGFFSHVLDFDDVHLAIPGRPTAPIAPAVIALSERDKLSGRYLLTAFVAGIELTCHVGLLLTPKHYDLGWHTTGTVGTFGAAAAASRLLNFSPDECATALGIAATQAAGLKCMFGTMCKPLHAGKAASNGLYAALLSKRGFTARADVLECIQGFCETHTSDLDISKWNVKTTLQDIGKQFHIQDVLFKYHAACFGTFATIEAAKYIRNAQKIDLANIDHIEIYVPVEELRVSFIEHPTTGIEAKFSLPHTVAMALAGKNTTNIASYDQESCVDSELVALRKKTRVIGEKTFATGIGETKVFLKDGTIFQKLVKVCEPEHDLATQAQKLKHKFFTLASPVIGEERAHQAIKLLLSLETLDNIDELMALCRISH